MKCPKGCWCRTARVAPKPKRSKPTDKYTTQTPPKGRVRMIG